MSYLSPPQSWYDPKEGHKEICNCYECHLEHLSHENYGKKDFQCCTDYIDDLIAAGLWCAVEPKEHNDTYMSQNICLECAAKEKAAS